MSTLQLLQFFRLIKDQFELLSQNREFLDGAIGYFDSEFAWN